MDYDQLIEGIKYFRDKWPSTQCEPAHTYESLRNRGPNYWLHLEKLDEAEIGEEIIRGFLNTKEWNCRIPTSTVDKWFKTLTELKKAIDQLPKFYAVLNSYSIVDVEFEKHILLDGEQETILEVIDRIYHAFLRMPTKFGKVPASKLMHMALPDLFIMWDNGILDKYCIPMVKLPGVKERQPIYPAFLILMQEHITHVTDTYPQKSMLTKQEIVRKIQSENDNLEISRLLDMSNMAVRDCELAICIPCMKKTKRRWAELGLTSNNNTVDCHE